MVIEKPMRVGELTDGQAEMALEAALRKAGETADATHPLVTVIVMDMEGVPRAAFRPGAVMAATYKVAFAKGSACIATRRATHWLDGWPGGPDLYGLSGLAFCGGAFPLVNREDPENPIIVGCISVSGREPMSKFEGGGDDADYQDHELAVEGAVAAGFYDKDFKPA